MRRRRSQVERDKTVKNITHCHPHHSWDSFLLPHYSMSAFWRLRRTRDGEKSFNNLWSSATSKSERGGGGHTSMCYRSCVLYTYAFEPKQSMYELAMNYPLHFYITSLLWEKPDLRLKCAKEDWKISVRFLSVLRKGEFWIPPRMHVYFINTKYTLRSLLPLQRILVLLHHFTPAIFHLTYWNEQESLPIKKLVSTN